MRNSPNHADAEVSLLAMAAWMWMALLIVLVC
jgi:hypothetical protein